MFTRRISHISVFLLLLVLSGCAGLRAFDAGSPEERRKNAASKEDLWNQSVALEKEKAAYQKRLADQQAEIERMRKELADQQIEIDQTSIQATELTGALDELTARVKQLQDARQREHPLKETNLTRAEKLTAKLGKKAVAPKKVVPKKTSPPKELEPQPKQEPQAKQEPQSKDDKEPQVKSPQEAEQAVTPPKEAEPAPVKKEEGKELTEAKTPQEVKAPKSSSVEELSAQMKRFEEAGQIGAAPSETEPGQTKKELLKQGKSIRSPKKEAQKEPAETKVRVSKAANIKVLAGDGNVDSARQMARQLGRMGYRVRSIDQAPRSDFEVTTVYYAADHRITAEAIAKKLGDGAVTKPLTWSTSFNIIVVTGRPQ